MYTKIKLILISLLSVILISSASFARDLVITFDDMNPGPKAAFENAIAKFQKENPDINVIANNGQWNTGSADVQIVSSGSYDYALQVRHNSYYNTSNNSGVYMIFNVC